MTGRKRSRESEFPKLPDWASGEAFGEKEMLGFYVTGHPFNEYIDKVSELATHNSESLEGSRKAEEVTVCGIITGHSEAGGTRKENPGPFPAGGSQASLK